MRDRVKFLQRELAANQDEVILLRKERRRLKTENKQLKNRIQKTEFTLSHALPLSPRSPGAAALVEADLFALLEQRGLRLFDALDATHGYVKGPLPFPGGRVDKEALLEALNPGAPGHAERLFLMLDSEERTREVASACPPRRSQG